jgi:protein TonB
MYKTARMNQKPFYRWKELHISASLHILVAAAVIICGWYVADPPAPVVVLLTGEAGGGGGGSTGNVRLRHEQPAAAPARHEPKKKRIRVKALEPPRPVIPAAATPEDSVVQPPPVAAPTAHVDPPVRAESAAGTRVAGTGSGTGTGSGIGSGSGSGSGSGMGSGSGSGTGSGAGASIGPGKGSGESAESLRKRYLREHFAYIRNLILKNLTYPPMARKLGWAGGVTVSFVVRENGYTEKIKIVKNSGYDILDQNVIRTIRDVEPFPRPPIKAELVIPVVYRLE